LENERAGRIQSVQRALSILDLLANASNPLSAIEIGKALGINRNTIHGLISTLVAENYVDKDDLTGKYYISMKMYTLSCAYPYKLDVVRYSDHAMAELSTRYNISLHFGMLSPSNQVVILNKYLPASMQNIRSGFVLPFHASGLGKTVLAFQPREKQEELLNSGPLYPYTRKTITDKAQLLSELDEIRINGFARDNGEFMDNTYCVAFPILGEGKRLEAAFSLSGSYEQINSNIDKIIPDCLQCSKRCSMELGWNLMP